MPRSTWKRLKMLSLTYTVCFQKRQRELSNIFLKQDLQKLLKIFFLVWINHFGTLYSMMIIIYFYCFHSEKLNVLEQIPPAGFGSFELLDRSEKKLEAGCCCPFKISPEVGRKENLGKDNIVGLTFPCQLSDYVRSSKRLAALTCTMMRTTIS